jgi:BON domain
MSRKGIRERLLRGHDDADGGIGFIALAAGLVVGLTAGAYLADRLGGVAGIAQRLRGRVGAVGGRTHRAGTRAAGGRAHDSGYDEIIEESEFESADAELEERVLEAFNNDPILSERAVDIGAVGPGTIELTGWVYTRGEIDHATTIARGVPDVRTVVNQITLRADEQSEGTKDALPGESTEPTHVEEGFADRARASRTDQGRSAP